MPADGVSQAIGTVINNNYMNTNYPVTFVFVGTPPDGCTLTNTDPGQLDNYPIFTAGTNTGTAHIAAVTDDPDPCLDTNFWFDLGTCAKCTGGESGCNSYDVGSSVDLQFGLGPSRFGVNNAFLEVLAESPSTNLGSPQSLKCNFIRPDLKVFTNPTNGWLRQVRSLDRVIDIIPVSPSSYLLNSYHPGDIVGFSGFPNTGSFQYYFTNSPYQTVMVELVGGDTNHLRVTDSADPAPSDFYWVTNGWTLMTGNGLRQHTKVTINNGDVYTNIVTIADGAGNVVHQSTETWQTFSYGNRLMQKTTGSGSAARTESYTYDPHGRLQQANHSDGSWDIYAYDARGRQTGHYQPFLNSAPTTDPSQCRYTASSYDPGVVSGSGDDGSVESGTPRRVINYVQGVEVSRTYTVVKSGERDEIQCVNPGAAWNAAGNLVTVTYYFTDAANLGKPSRIIRPDGTLQVFSYGTAVTAPVPGADASYDETAVWTGAPDSSMENVVDGTRDETWTDSLHHTVLHRITDIASGIITDQQRFYYDDRGHLVHTVYLNGTTTGQTYDCCNLVTNTAPDGTATSYGYDALKRRVMTTVNGVTMSDILDANGNVLGSVRYGTDDSAITNGLSTYDDASQLVSSTDALGHTTSYTNYFGENGQYVRVTTYPDLTTRIETSYRDGSLQSETGTAVSPVRYVYGVESDGSVQRTYTETIPLDAGGNDTAEWTKTYTDGAGRAYKTVYADNASSQSFYNSYGQLVRQVDPDGVATLYQYNAKGEPAYTAVDMNTNGVIDFRGMDRITASISDVATKDANCNVRRTRTFIWANNNTSVSNLVSTTETSVDGLQSWNITWNNGVGVTNYSRTVYDPTNGYVTAISVAPDGSTTVSASQSGRLISVTWYDTNIAHVGDMFGHQISQTIYGYDAHGRQNTVTDARCGTTTSFFNNADQVTATLTPSPDGIQAGQLTTNVLDSMGRVIQTILPDSTSVTNIYYPNGLLQQTCGSRTYPVAYTYDYAGRIKTMTTWTNFASSTGAAVTAWNYDGYRGFLTNKAYADGKGPSYTYTAAGRLHSRLWARGITTTYTYDNAGSLSAVDYSDTTPGVANTYDRRGRQIAVTNGATVCNWTYNNANEPLTESYTGGPLNGVCVSNGYDQFLRRTNLSALSANSKLLSTIYAYDPVSRLFAVSDGTNAAFYSYVANSPLVGNIVFQHNGQTMMTTTKTYDYLNRLTGISSSSSSSFNYTYNSANQRTRADVGGASSTGPTTYWLYQYDPLGQVISGKKYWSDGTPVAGQQFNYTFDTIGNRMQTQAGGDGTGTNLRIANYSANALNQYTSRDVPGYVTVLGSANSNATVTVNLQRAVRQGSYFWDELNVDNSSSALWLSLTNLAVLNNGTNADIVATNTGNVFLPQTPETFGYDLDGNMTNSGRWMVTWDAENQAISFMSLSSAPTASMKKVDCAYDYQGRRIQKIVSTNNGSAWIPVSTNRFVYDGWNLVAILNSDSSLLASFQWGTDLSGSQQGAGGVGGLISMTMYSGANAGTYFYSFDGNGNLAALVNAANGSLAAQYEYGPFGEVIRSTGSLALVNPFRFSTKYQDDETGLLYYGYRYYDPSAGRWPNRDPLEEQGGGNLNGFAGNEPIGGYDIFGLKWVIERTHGARATVYATSSSDTVNELALQIGLTASQYQKWLQPADAKISTCKKYTIPNQVIIVVGEISFWPKPRKTLDEMASSGANILYEKGFSVNYINRSVQAFGANDVTGLVGPNLYGFAFFGHGTTAPWPFYNPNLGGDFKIAKGEEVSPAEMKNQFDYGLIITYLCSAAFANWQQIGSPNDVYWGSTWFYQINGLNKTAVNAAFKSVK